VYGIQFCATVALWIVLAGCTRLHHGPGQPASPPCPKQNAAALTDGQNTLGPLSTSDALTCALAVLGNPSDPLLPVTALGSRLYLHLAERAADPVQRRHYAAKGVEWAEAALAKSGENDGAVHYYLAANLGLLVRDNLLLAISSLPRLERAMRRAAHLSPYLDQGGPLRLLGALYLKAPAWPDGIGDLDRALELLEKAASDYPNHPMNRLFYAQALWAEGSETSRIRAKSEFSLGRNLLATGDWGYQSQPWANEFAAFAKQLEAF